MILGATAGAGMGAALALLLSWSAAAVQLTAFVFGLAAVALTYYFAHIISRKAGMILSLVLTGIVMSALFEAGISLMKYVADPYSKLPGHHFLADGLFGRCGSLFSAAAGHPSGHRTYSADSPEMENQSSVPSR